MTDKPHTPREKRVRRHNAATLAALLSFVAYVAIKLSGGESIEPVKVIAVLVMFPAILVMYATRNADEYVAAIWRSGTSSAFVMTVAVLLVLPFFEGFYDGITGGDRKQDLTLPLDAGLVLIGTFFLGNGSARWRGTM